MGRDRHHDEQSAQKIEITVEGRKVVLLAAEDDTGVLDKLTDAERSVALLATEGLSSNDIAKRRECSVRTVANHLSSVYEKLGISSREQLVSRLSGDTSNS